MMGKVDVPTLLETKNQCVRPRHSMLALRQLAMDGEAGVETEALIINLKHL